MSDHAILQRVRFAPQSRNPGESSLFSKEAWLRKRESLYWQPGSLDGDTFFNAFPLNHWRTLTRLESLFLHLEVEGPHRLDLFAHDALAERHSLGSFPISTGEFIHPFAFSSLPANPLRLSFTLTPLDKEAKVLESSWRTGDALPPFRPVILISLNRPSAIADRLLADPVLESLGVSLRIVDQTGGTAPLPSASSRCRIVSQPDRGGIGGLWRAVMEEGGATHFLTLDDEIEFDPDSVLRAFRLAQLARKPFLLAGMMLDPLRPQIMAAAGFAFHKTIAGFHEILCYLREMNVATPQGFNAVSIPYPSQLNPWSFSLIPAEIFKKAGPPLPLFHPPDADFGHRVLESGYEIATVPGIGGWHFYERQKTRVTRFFEKYNPLVANAQLGYLPCARQFDQHVMEAAQFLIRHRYGACVNVLLAMEHFLGGWTHFRARTFPRYAAALKEELGLYPADEEVAIPTPHPELYAHLQKRLDMALAIFQTLGKKIQAEWAEKLPRAATQEAWDGFLASGNLTSLPE